MENKIIIIFEGGRKVSEIPLADAIEDFGSLPKFADDMAYLGRDFVIQTLLPKEEIE